MLRFYAILLEIDVASAFKVAGRNRRDVETSLALMRQGEYFVEN